MNPDSCRFNFFCEKVHDLLVRYPLVDQVGELLVLEAVVADGILKVGMGGFTRATYTGGHFFFLLFQNKLNNGK
jgi:hypothetical protein